MSDVSITGVAEGCAGTSMCCLGVYVSAAYILWHLFSIWVWSVTHVVQKTQHTAAAASGFLRAVPSSASQICVSRKGCLCQFFVLFYNQCLGLVSLFVLLWDSSAAWLHLGL